MTSKPSSHITTTTYSAAAARAQASLADIIHDPVVRDFGNILAYIGNQHNVNSAVPLFEIRDKVGIDMTLMHLDPHLQRVHAMLCDHEKVSYDPETKSYVHAAEFKITRAEDLMAVLATRPRGLKWKTQLEHCGTHMQRIVQELARDGKIFILYKDIHGYEGTLGYGPSDNDGSSPDQQPPAGTTAATMAPTSTTTTADDAKTKYAGKVPFDKILRVYLNKFHADEQCAQVSKVASNVLDQFFAVKVPDDVDLGLKLAKVGLKAHAVKVRGVPTGSAAGGKKKKDSKADNKRHRFKLTNTHLLGDGAEAAGGGESSGQGDTASVASGTVGGAGATKV